MRVRLPMMIQDPEIAQLSAVGRLVEDWLGLEQEHLLDGPVTTRLAVVDLDPDTEELQAAVAFARPSGYRLSTEPFTASQRWLLKMTVRSGRRCARSTNWQDTGSLKKYAPSPTVAMTVWSGRASSSPSAAPRPKPRPLEWGEPK